MIKYQVIIPAYNAENTIATLLSQIRALDVQPQEIIVIDDGSTDTTAEKCEEHRVRLIRTIKNSGKGHALKVGFETALQSSETEYILCMDADLQHPVTAIRGFLEKAEVNGSRFIIGNRSRWSRMPLHRILSNTITSFLISRLSGQKIEDSQCGFRLIHKNVLKNLDLTENGYQLESEMIIKAARNGIMIDSLEIPTIYNSEASYMRHLADTLRFIRLIGRETYNKIINKRLRRRAS